MVFFFSQKIKRSKNAKHFQTFKDYSLKYEERIKINNFAYFFVRKIYFPTICNSISTLEMFRKVKIIAKNTFAHLQQHEKVDIFNFYPLGLWPK